jgi:hypothetical protein
MPSPFHDHEPVPGGSAAPGPEHAGDRSPPSRRRRAAGSRRQTQAGTPPAHNRSTQTSAGRSGPQQSADGQPVTGAETVSTTGLAHSRQHHPALQIVNRISPGDLPPHNAAEADVKSLPNSEYCKAACITPAPRFFRRTSEHPQTTRSHAQGQIRLGAGPLRAQDCRVASLGALSTP